MTQAVRIMTRPVATNKNLLALDVGMQRIGVAIASANARLPKPMITIINDNDVMLHLKEIINQQGAGLLVVGLPKNLSGQDTDQTIITRQFVDELIEHTNIPFYWQDEALSSVRAKQELLSRKKKFDKSDIDSLAAVYILEDFINENKDIIDEIFSKK